ncbi:hypothetical protein RI129_005148 [Pyrocoelia pectoralis]|uniref:Exosome complex component 10 homolog n=1 Tax=Pyrocoelia pectoralis TaxID=417401 RepID=A0AAN7VMW8_9COLE
MEENVEIIAGFSTIDDYIKKGFQVLLEATKSSNALPSLREWDFYKTYDSFNKILNNEGDRLLRLTNTVLHNQEQNVNIRNRDMDEKMEMLIEANDNILEKVALCIDELNGIKKSNQGNVQIQAVSAQLPVNGSWNQLNKATFSVSSSIDHVKESNSLNSIRLLTAKNIVRPQTYFKDKIDNSNNPWIPRITEKPNSIKPLAIFLEESEFGEMYSHPYEVELDHFIPPPHQLQTIIPPSVKPLDETPLIEVSTPEELGKLLEDLRQQTEFAVDLEHHSYRTFMGITCLMQISTRNADYLVDTFTLRDQLFILNEVFTKPSIVKIFHGADMDVQWLQRDLSLYVVNMFDTHQAAKQLEYSGLSLAYLLNRFCNVIPNKHFQLADWRIRPLPDELKTYARMDTHYLIYIYCILRNELLKKGNGCDNILKSVLSQSTDICKKSYIKPILTEDSHMDFYRKCKRLFDNRQMFALKELFHWRDRLARIEDESTGYVLPNHMLLQISETLPREVQGIIASCNPVPPLVRANLLEIHQLILKAREQSLTQPILKDDNRSRGSTLRFAKVNIDSPLHCPHDLSKSTEFRDDLPTLLDTVTTVYDKSFLAPYQRYELIRPFIRAEEEKATTVQTNENNQKELSNEDRIAAPHEHFVKVSKGIPQIPIQSIKEELPEHLEETESSIVNDVLESYPTLRSMCGSKKRKRIQYEDDCEQPNEESPRHQIHEIHTPIPNWKKKQPFSQRGNKKRKPNNQKNTNKKQKTQESFQQPEQENQQNTNKKQKRKGSLQQPQQQNQQIGNKKQKRQGSLQQPQQQNQQIANKKQKRQGSHQQFQQQNQQIANKKQKRQGSFQQPKQRNQQNANKKQKTQGSSQQPQQQNTNKKKKTQESFQQPKQANLSSKQQRKNQWKNKQNEQQIEKQFQPFDYSSVNFQQFQGGAGRSKNNKNEFKAKNKRKRDNRNFNNKSMTYCRRQ